MAGLFDQVADDYDAVGVEFFKPIAAGLVDELAPRPGERVVDLGCGRGAALVPLAQAVGSTGAVTGIDISPRMVELAVAETAAAGLVADIRVGDASAPDLPAGSFDVAASSLALFFLPDPLVALGAWLALLVEGGRLGVSTFGPYSRQWRDEVDTVLAAYAAPGAADARTTGRTGPFASDEGMESLFSQAGYRNVRTATTTVSARFAGAEHWFRWSMSVGQRRFWQAIPDADLDAVKRAVFAAVDRCRDQTGRIGFDQSIRYTMGVR